MGLATLLKNCQFQSICLDKVPMNKKLSLGASHFVKWWTELIGETFAILLVIYLAFALLEIISSGSVSSHINLFYFFIIIIMFGFIAVLALPMKEETFSSELTLSNILTMICAGIIGVTIIWYKSRELEWLSFIASIAGGVLTVFLSLLMWQGNQDEENNTRSNQDN